jgi:hypothetical protein
MASSTRSPLRRLRMKRHEIDEMMRGLPSQKEYYEEPFWDKVLGGLSFILIVITICLI